MAISQIHNTPPRNHSVYPTQGHVQASFFTISHSSEHLHAELMLYSSTTTTWTSRSQVLNHIVEAPLSCIFVIHLCRTFLPVSPPCSAKTITQYHLGGKSIRSSVSLPLTSYHPGAEKVLFSLCDHSLLQTGYFRFYKLHKLA